MHTKANENKPLNKVSKILEGMGGFSKIENLMKKGGPFRPLEHAPQHPTVLHLRDTNNCETHAVGLAAGWIFDANRSHALPVTKLNLGECCNGAAFFKEAVAAFRFTPGNKLLQHRFVPNIQK